MTYGKRVAMAYLIAAILIPIFAWAGCRLIDVVDYLFGIDTVTFLSIFPISILITLPVAFICASICRAGDD